LPGVLSIKATTCRGSLDEAEEAPIYCTSIQTLHLVYVGRDRSIGKAFCWTGGPGERYT
jgi:hypothetical protein